MIKPDKDLGIYLSNDNIVPYFYKYRTLNDVISDTRYRIWNLIYDNYQSCLDDLVLLYSIDILLKL
jgi:hypothetical protein